MQTITANNMRLFHYSGPFAWLVVACVNSTTCNAAGLIEVGSAAGMRYIIDSSTLKFDGQVLRYRLVGQGTLPNFQVAFTAEVGIDCAARTRIEYLSVSTWNGRTTTTTAASPEMRSVYEGTRQADELTAACMAANLKTSRPDLLPEPKPQEPRSKQSPDHSPKQPIPLPVVRGPKSSGTGFAVSADGVFLTNHHVISGCTSVRGIVNNQLLEANVIALDEANDLAAVRIETVRFPALPIAATQPELGSSITVLGFPLSSVLGTDLKATAGIVSSLSGVRGERRSMQISAAVQPGNSGGPVLDDSGQVVGVVVARLASRFAAENVNFAIRGPLIRSFLEINSIEYLAGKQQSQLSVAEVVKRAAPSTLLLLCY